MVAGHEAHRQSGIHQDLHRLPGVGPLRRGVLVGDVAEVEDRLDAPALALRDEPTGLREVGLRVFLGIILRVRQHREGEGTLLGQGRLAVDEDRPRVRVGLGLQGRLRGLGPAGEERHEAQREGAGAEEEGAAGGVAA